MNRLTLLAALLPMACAVGCDVFISRGGEGQPCFEETRQCEPGLTCIDGRCEKTTASDGGQDGGDDEDGGADAGADPGEDAGTDAGEDAGQDAGSDEGTDAGHDAGTDAGGDVDPTEPVSVYRSVEPGNVNDLAAGSGSNQMTLVNGRATFELPLPTNVGVGDVIQYDTNDNISADSLAIITGRFESDEYAIPVTSVSGGPATPTPSGNPTHIWQIYRAYTSLADAVSMVENIGLLDGLEDFDDASSDRNLVGAGKVWNIACYAGVDGTAVRIEGWNTDEDHHVRIFTPVGLPDVVESQRHAGRWDEGNAYRLEVEVDGAVQAALQISGDQHVHLDGLQIFKTSAVSASGRTVRIPNENSHVWISNSILRGTGTEGQGIELGISMLKMWNSVIYDSAATSGTGLWISPGAQGFLYNVTLFNNVHGIELTSGTECNLVVKNVLAMNHTQGAFDTVTYGTGSSNNLSSDDTAPSQGIGEQTATAFNMIFVGAGMGDFHLKPATEAVDGGADLSSDPGLSFPDDIDGQTRADGTWDVGADEYVP